jgi:lambda family phage portal protein
MKYDREFASRYGLPIEGQAPSARRAPNHTSVRQLFNSGDVGRLTGDWPTMPVPAEWIIHKYQRTLVARMREQAHNNDYVKAYLRLCRQNIVGSTGIVYQARAKNGKGLDLVANSALEAAFTDWGKRENCDVAGKLSWRAMQDACTLTAARDGEFMVRKVHGKNGGKYRFALQMLDPQRCPVDFDRFDLKDGAFIRSGIEFNEFGKPLAYHFLNQDARHQDMAYSYAGRSFTRIPADEIIHGFRAEMIGQKRGLPWLATGLFRVKQMGAFEDAAVVNARVGAAKMGVIQYEDGAGPEPDDEPETISAEAGEFITLPSGATLEKFDPLYPSGEFAPFMKQCLRSMAAGGGVSYHNLAQDLEGVNFSSIRQGTLDEREHFKELQEWLAEELCAPVRDAWLPRALLGGLVVDENGRALRADQVDKLSPCEWQGRRWQWIDPRADMDAAESAKNNFLASPSALIREQGRDPSAVWHEVASDIAEMKAAGIPDELIALAFGKPPQKPASAPPKESQQ